MSEDSLDDSSEHTTNLSMEKLEHFCECIDTELSDNDLIETNSTPSNFKRNASKRFETKSFEMMSKHANRNLLFGNKFSNCSDILNNLNETHLCTNNTVSECGHDNIDACLLDLDNYLEKMDEDDLYNNDNKAVANYSTIVTSKGISSSIRNKNFSIKKSQFVRSSKLRNTINCTLNKKRIGDDVYAACDQLETRNTKILDPLDINVDMDMPQSSTAIKKSKSFENIRNFQTIYSSGIDVLTNDHIFQNLIKQQDTSMQNIEIERPRQFGRRAERLQIITTPLNRTDQNCEYISFGNIRPISAPASTGISVTDGRSNNIILYAVSDDSTSPTSRNGSPNTIESCTDSGESFVVSDNIMEVNSSMNEQDSGQDSTAPINSEHVAESLSFKLTWPHNYIRTFALISCTLGLFNISRFALLTIIYGANFVIQFLILSVIFGIPFLWLQMSLGSKIAAGPISMWKISPICIGIGISLIFVQYFITIYSSVVVVWLLIYIRDIFLHRSSYPWSNFIYPNIERQSPQISTNLTETISDYLNIYVLQRLNISNVKKGNAVHINDRVAFYLIILWTIVFLMLWRGSKSVGKMMLLLGILSNITLVAITVKLLLIVDIPDLQKAFSSYEFGEFMVNSKSWAAAAQEVFFTWGLLGASIIAISSRSNEKFSKFKLRSDGIIVVLVTLIGLCLSSLVGLCSIQILNKAGYVYVPGSYENPDYYSAIFSVTSSSAELVKYPIKFVPHYSTLIGDTYRRQADIKNVSGYQVLRFITELIPAVVTISKENISWIWTSVIFITFFLFGVLQLCVMWKPVSCVLGNSTSALLLSCVTGLLLSIPFATEIGITLLHYMDILLGGAWFIPILWATEIFGVFLIRGRPYNGDDLVKDLKMPGFISSILALSWNVFLPIGLITLAVIEYKISLSSHLYFWHGKSYFSCWSRKVAGLSQIGFLLLVPISSMIQIWRYLSSGPPDILDRIQMLYRPLNEGNGVRNTNGHNENIMYSQQHDENLVSREFQDEAPPKYTPPPSYTTATGAKLAKIFRKSLRRSVRRILGESERSTTILTVQRETENEQVLGPSVLSSAVRTVNEISTTVSESMEIENRNFSGLLHGRSLSLGRHQLLQKRLVSKANRRSPILNNRPFTAEDVMTVLNSSSKGLTGVLHSIHSENKL